MVLDTTMVLDVAIDCSRMDRFGWDMSLQPRCEDCAVTDCYSLPRLSGELTQDEYDAEYGGSFCICECHEEYEEDDDEELDYYETEDDYDEADDIEAKPAK